MVHVQGRKFEGTEGTWLTGSCLVWDLCCPLKAVPQQKRNLTILRTQSPSWSLPPNPEKEQAVLMRQQIRPTTCQAWQDYPGHQQLNTVQALKKQVNKILFGLGMAQPWLFAVYLSDFQSNRGLFYPLNYLPEPGQPVTWLSHRALRVGRDSQNTFPNQTPLLREPST